MHSCRMLTNIPSVHPVKASSIPLVVTTKNVLKYQICLLAGSLLSFHLPQNPHGSFPHFTHDCSLNLPERDFPGGPVKTPHSQSRGMGSNPGWGTNAACHSYCVCPGEQSISVCLPITASRFYLNKTCFSSQDLLFGGFLKEKMVRAKIGAS